MNIDIATLLLGSGAPGKPKAGLLADENFSLALDDKLAELAQLFPGLDPQMLAALPEAALPAGLLPGKLADDAPVLDDEGRPLPRRWRRRRQRPHRLAARRWSPPRCPRRQR